MSHKKKQQIETIDKTNDVGMRVTQTQEGILPPVEDLERLESLQPGTIDRFMKLAEKDQKYYIQNDYKYFNKVVSLKNKGALLSFFAFLSINILAGYMVYEGYSGEAVALVISELVVGLIAYIRIDSMKYQHTNNNKDGDSK